MSKSNNKTWLIGLSVTVLSALACGLPTNVIPSIDLGGGGGDEFLLGVDCVPG